MISPRQARRARKILGKKLQMELRDKFKELIKPKPKWMPWRLWKFLQNLLLDLKNFE